MKDFEKKGTYHNLGDKLERIGEKIGGKLGRRIYEFGNKLEHKNERAKVANVGGKKNVY